MSKLDEAFKTFHTLADEAPSRGQGRLEDPGQRHHGQVETALKKAGLKFADFAKLQEGKMPEGVDVEEELQGLATEFQKLNSTEFDKASKAIEKHAKDECKVDLS